MGKHSSVLSKASDYLSPRFWPTWIVLGLIRLACLLPFRTLLRVGSVLGRLIMMLSGKRTIIVDINLARCFPEKSAAERERIKRACYQNLGISIMEMGMCWWWSDEKLKPLVEIKGQEHVDAALAAGRGVILLAGHFACLEISGRLISYYMPLQVMYRTQRNALFDSYLYTQRSKLYVNTISRKNTRQMIKGLRSGIPTWYAPDQDFRRERNVFAPFMGIPAATITASSRLAESAGAAMLPHYPERKADGSGYIIHIDPPLENFPSDDELQDASAVNAAIEKYVRLFPETYMWIHQRFKTRPPGEAPFYS